MKRKRGRLKPPSPRAAGRGIDVGVVAIVGRPNVGKSSLFNRIVGRRVSIVEPTAGVTRDRVSALVELPGGRVVELVDTGGLGGSDDNLAEDVDTQIEVALRYADAIVFLVDGREGVMPLDQTLSRKLQRMGKPVVLAANKCETADLEDAAGVFWELGEEPLPVSANHGYGIEEMLERLEAVVPEKAPELPPTDRENREMRVAIVGRRNVGKSTYTNALFGEERVIVSDRPGTTRDSVDVRVEVGGLGLTLIDTAGLRRRGRFDDAIEHLSHVRAREAVARSDVALLLLDATDRVSLVDKQLARLIVEEYKACVLVGTKWDLVGGSMSVEDYSDYLARHIPALRHAPVVALSSVGELNVEGPIKAAQALWEQARTRVNTARLNKAIRAAYDKKRPRVRRNILPRIYFATQIATNPVAIVLFVNKPSLFSQGYRRYLANQLRAELPYREVPIKFIFRERVNIFEAGLHKRVRTFKVLDDPSFLSQAGVEEKPADGSENVEDVFEMLFGEREGDLQAGLDDILELARSNPRLFTDVDAPLPEGFEDGGEGVFDEARDAPSEEEEDAPHPMQGGGG